MKKPLSEDNRGLTLVELIIGVTILAIIIVPLLHAFIVGAGTERKSHEYNDATNAAQNLLEQIQATDADLILGNAQTVALGAKFYKATSSDPEYTSLDITVAPPIDNGKYYIGIPSYSYDDSDYDALITLDTNDAINNTKVSVSNQMGAYLDMSSAETNTVASLQAECGGLVESLSELNINALTRSINLNISKSSVSGTNTYTVDVLFNYTGMIPYSIENQPGTYYYNFTHTETSSESVITVSEPTDGSPVFSVYMFFDGYYKNDINKAINENITIINPTGSDINIFLVNTDTNPYNKPTYYSAFIWYKCQEFDGNNPVNDLVFTNLSDGKIKYYAFRDLLNRKTLTVSGYLVELNQFERKFNINVKLFTSGSNFSGNPILNIDSTKLN